MNSSDPLLIVGSIAFDDLDMPTGEYRDVLGGAATYASLAASLVARGGARVVHPCCSKEHHATNRGDLAERAPPPI